MNAIHQCLLRSVPLQSRVSIAIRLGLPPWGDGKWMLTSATQLAVAIPPRHLSEAMPEKVKAMSVDLRIALYQPDIPGNTGTILRMAACFDLAVDIIEPAGFDLSNRALRRAGMDYTEQALIQRHLNWQNFLEWRETERRRLVLATTKAERTYVDFEFNEGDILLFGRESAGVPEEVHAVSDARLRIPMVPGKRSLNLAVSVALVAGEALRQTDQLIG